MVQTIWSPDIIYMEKKMNKKNLYDLKLEKYERAVTFDGDE